MNGLFITFEGPEGAGKTTQIRLLAETLLNRSKKVELVREPGGSEVGEKIRKLLLDPEQKICSATEVYLYAAARAQLVKDIIKPALEAGKIVLCDRFVDASIAYQGWGRGLGAKQVREVNKLALAGLIPDLTVLLDLPVEEGLNRAGRRRNGLDRIERESLEFHQTVRRGYLALAAEEPDRFLVVDAGLPVAVIREAIRKKIEELLGQKA
ncbi:MAG TPA: dTMP kinase [Desulfobacteria bacterium]|nr:dTMP kinase [Desulfobacteria bacterium]